MKNEYMKQTYFLDPRDKPGLLVALMRQLAGNAHIALEGDREDMETMDFSVIPDAVEGLVAPFRHEWDKNGKFIVLPLTDDTIAPILEEVLPEGRIVHKVGAIQIEKDGDIQFLAGDNFHRESVSVGPAVPERLLRDLMASGVLWTYYSIEEGVGQIIKKIRGKGKL